MDGPNPVDFLDEGVQHFGIKGMHWGVRRGSRESMPSSTDAKTARSAADVVKTHGVNALTNRELQTLVTRMNLERQLATLNAQNKANNPAVKFAKELLVEIGKDQARGLARQAITGKMGFAIAKGAFKGAAKAV